MKDQAERVDALRGIALAIAGDYPAKADQLYSIATELDMMDVGNNDLERLPEIAATRLAEYLGQGRAPDPEHQARIALDVFRHVMDFRDPDETDPEPGDDAPDYSELAEDSPIVGSIRVPAKVPWGPTGYIVMSAEGIRFEPGEGD